MISDFLELMPDTVTYTSVTGRNAEGLPSQGTPVSFRARVIRKAVRTANRFTGQDEIAAGQIWIAGVIYPGMDDKITLPDGSTPFIINYETFTDEHGPHHTKVYFGATQSSRSQ